MNVSGCMFDSNLAYKDGGALQLVVSRDLLNTVM